jgi:hypothetical protein
MDRKRIRHKICAFSNRSLFNFSVFFRHDFKLKQLVLVVGTGKTNSWAIACAVASDSEIVENLTFTISLVTKAKVWGKWSKNLSVSRCGLYMGECVDMDFFVQRL